MESSEFKTLREGVTISDMIFQYLISAVIYISDTRLFPLLYRSQTAMSLAQCRETHKLN